MSDPGVVGLVLANSRTALVARNSVSGSTGYAMFLVGIDDSRIQNNKLDGDEHGFLLGGSARNLVRSNAVSHSGGGIEVVGGSTANLVEHNRFNHTGDGMLVGDASDNLIRHNLVTGAGGGEAGGFGIILDGAVHTTVDRNIFIGGRGPAIFVTKLEAAAAPRDTVISCNFVNSKLSDGILVDNGATGTLLVGNLAIRNGDDGIDVDAPATTVTRNIANHNHDLASKRSPASLTVAAITPPATATPPSAPTSTASSVRSAGRELYSRRPLPAARARAEPRSILAGHAIRVPHRTDTHGTQRTTTVTLTPPMSWLSSLGQHERIHRTVLRRMCSRR